MFVTLEGGEGVGKSSLCQALRDALVKKGHEVVVTLEPGGTAVGRTIREIFLHPPEDQSLSVLTELFLVSAARAQHVADIIQPALTAGKVVICDRFYDSTWVYQGVVGGIKLSEVEALSKLATAHLVPDVTFVMDCPVEVSLARIKSRLGPSTRFDDQDNAFHQKIREAFLSRAQNDPHRITVLDAQKSLDELVGLAMQAMERQS